MSDACARYLSAASPAGNCGKLVLSRRARPGYHDVRNLGIVHDKVTQLLEQVLEGLLGMYVRPVKHYYCFDSCKASRGRELDPSELGGGSLDLPYLVAAFSLVARVDPRPDVACTGAIETSGGFLPVDELLRKLQAAVNSGVVSAVVLPQQVWEERDEQIIDDYRDSLDYVRIGSIADVFDPANIGAFFDVESLREFLNKWRERLLAIKAEAPPTEMARKVIENLQACARAPFGVCDPFARYEWTLDSFLAALLDQEADVEHDQYRDLVKSFVAPRKFDRMLKVLKDERIVFLLGPPHTGKTFIAANLLWHYCRTEKGKEPLWLLPKDLTEQEPDPDPTMPRRWPPSTKSWKDQIIEESGKNTNRIIHIEDPFGKTLRDEARCSEEDARKDISELWEYVQAAPPETMVIVTSRDMIFDRIAGRDRELEKLVFRLTTTPSGDSRGSYGEGKMDELVEKYARQCVWRKEACAEDIACKASAELRTPRAVALFCHWSRYEKTTRDCLPHLERAARQLVKGFANEIVTLGEDQVAFLIAVEFGQHGLGISRSLPSVLSTALARSTGSDVRAAWDAAANPVGYRVDWREGVADNFICDEYDRALKLALHVSDKLRHLFNQMVSNLAESSDEYMCRVAIIALCAAIESVGAEAPEDRFLDAAGEELLRRLGNKGNDFIRLELGRALGRKFCELRRQGQELVGTLADNTRLAAGVAAGLAAQYGRDLSEKGRELLVTLVANGDGELHEAVLQDIPLRSNLDENGCALFEKLATDEAGNLRYRAVYVLARNYSSLSAARRKLVAEFAGNRRSEEVREAVAYGLAMRYDSLDKTGRAIVEKLADHKKDKGVIFAICYCLRHLADANHLDEDGEALLERIQRRCPEHHRPPWWLSRWLEKPA